MKSLCGFLFCVAYAAGASAECAPAELVRMETQDVSPAVPAGSFAGLPKVTYRLGNGRIRLEERADPAMGVQMLIVTDTPQVWIIELNSKTGEHHVDPDKPSKARAPIFEAEGLPAELSALEFGCERDFIAKLATIHDRHESPGGVAIKHSLRSGNWKVTLVVREGATTPMAAMLSRDEKLVQTIRYRSYEIVAQVPEGLFAPPPGIAFKD